MAENKVIVNETINKLVVSSPGTQGPRGRTILNGTAAPSNNLGLEGDFYYNTITTEFYGPKLSDVTWAGANIITLYQEPTDFAFTYSWGVGEIVGPVNGSYSLAIVHNMGFYPNVTVKTSAGDILETGIEYDNINKITLTMAQPFSGTAYLS
jgi:hypothetical protein